jgi:hypothetical protein
MRREGDSVRRPTDADPNARELNPPPLGQGRRTSVATGAPARTHAELADR